MANSNKQSGGKQDNGQGGSVVDNVGSQSAPDQEPILESQGLDPNELLARLEAAESQLKERDDTIAGLKDEVSELTQAGGLKFSPKEQPFAGPDGGYNFVVTPKVKADDPSMQHLKPRKVKCCDESEALRWYCQVNENKPGTGMALDPMKVQLHVECVDDARQRSLMRQKQIAALRRKVENGQQLSAADNKLLATCEEEIYGYSS